MIFRVEPVLLDPDSAVLRRPPRAPEFRQPGYDEQFDYRTLAYDAVAGPNGRVRIVCPPLDGIAEHLSVTDLTGAPLPFVIHALDKLAEIVVKNVGNADGVLLAVAGRRYRVPIRRSPDLTFFQDMPVLFAISKDNALDWIADWAEFHAAIHGVRGLLIFDNRSAEYSLEDLHARLSTVPGLEKIGVVDWPVMWGPERGLNKRWDSNFAHHGALGVARWRFLESASLVTQADIDELVVPLGDASLKAACEQSRWGAVLYRGLWVVGVENAAPAPRDPGRRHRHYHHILLDETGYRARLRCKWTISPQRAAGIRQWQNHLIDGIPDYKGLSAAFQFRHFHEITTSWKSNRRHERLPAGDPRTSADERLANMYRRIGWLD